MSQPAFYDVNTYQTVSPVISLLIVNIVNIIVNMIRTNVLPSQPAYTHIINHVRSSGHIISKKNLFALCTLIIMIPYQKMIQSEATAGFVGYLQNQGYSVPSWYFSKTGGDIMGLRITILFNIFE